MRDAKTLVLETSAACHTRRKEVNGDEKARLFWRVNELVSFLPLRERRWRAQWRDASGAGTALSPVNDDDPCKRLHLADQTSQIATGF